mmetsp:Transcript_2016/g.4661  ORF Transcript_2016/g.4661 Transcript_2016/m.4661 type:complete len:312 (+) Transcript_2016:1172-2107(+)
MTGPLPAALNESDAEKIFPTGPLLVLCDRPRTHDGPEVAKVFMETEDVIVLFFPHNMTTKLQPLDRKIFGLHKRKYRIGLKNINVALSDQHMRLAPNVCDRIVAVVRDRTLPETRLFGLEYLQRQQLVASECAWRFVTAELIREVFANLGMNAASVMQSHTIIILCGAIARQPRPNEHSFYRDPSLRRHNLEERELAQGLLDPDAGAGACGSSKQHSRHSHQEVYAGHRQGARGASPSYAERHHQELGAEGEGGIRHLDREEAQGNLVPRRPRYVQEKQEDVAETQRETARARESCSPAYPSRVEKRVSDS